IEPQQQLLLLLFQLLQHVGDFTPTGIGFLLFLGLGQWRAMPHSNEQEHDDQAWPSHSGNIIAPSLEWCKGAPTGCGKWRRPPCRAAMVETHHKRKRSDVSAKSLADQAQLISAPAACLPTTRAGPE